MATEFAASHLFSSDGLHYRFRGSREASPPALLPNPGVAAIQCIPGALSAAECSAVIALGESLPSMDGRAELAADSYRVSRIAWIELSERTGWLYQRMERLFQQANQAFRFDLIGLRDALQFTHYGPGEHFAWHLDIGHDESSLRKLSVTVLLSDAGDYAGGDLEFATAQVGPQARQRGAAVFFPSYLLHRVSPVTNGERRSLVAWAAGKPFR